MDYSEEEVYALVGRQDKTATVIFKIDTDSYELYGSHVTVLFLYTQYEREELDERIKNSPQANTPGIIQVRHLTSQLDKEKIEQLEGDGIKTNHIASILYFKSDTQNTFHSKEKRTITKIRIPIHIQPKGRDLDWMYGFSKRLVDNGIGLSPKERQFYLAGKLYYESEVLTDDERSEIFDDAGDIYFGVEFEYLKIKYRREEANDSDKRRLGKLIRKKDNDDMDLLDKYLKETGSSLSKLAKDDLDTATKLLVRVSKYQEKHINIVGKKAIYLDIDRYLHVQMRHVKEMKINKQFAHKSNFQWNEEDVLVVIDKVIEKINDEIQNYFEKAPGKRYSRYGRKSVYFEGDYYTLHIEANGAISTFHRTWKEHEQDEKE
jgi:hypothetical protein